jgi:CBS domain-containing protein
MKAKHVMTTPVVTIELGASVSEVAALLIERRISGVPVISNGEVVGMVSEGDLLRRHEIGTDRFDNPWWARLFDGDRATAQYVRSHATRAADIMTRPVISVTEDTPIADVVSLLESHRIRRVPVLRDRQLAGIVSRANLVQTLALTARRAVAQRAAGDKEIREQLLAELAGQTWWQRYSSTLTVSGGVVHFWGLRESEDEKTAARVAAENIPGVRNVVDHRERYDSLSTML